MNGNRAVFMNLSYHNRYYVVNMLYTLFWNKFPSLINSKNSHSIFVSFMIQWRNLLRKGGDREVKFGQWVKMKRIEFGISPELFCERSGMKSPNLSRLENNSPEMPRRETVDMVSEGLKLPVAECLKAAGYDTIGDIELDMRLAKRLEPILRTVSPSRREKIVDALESAARAMASV
jgi:transcriptional regulator with XRE-family HTH domain